MKFDIVGDGPARKYFQIRWSDQKEQKKYINSTDSPYSKKRGVNRGMQIRRSVMIY